MAQPGAIGPAKQTDLGEGAAAGREQGDKSSATCWLYLAVAAYALVTYLFASRGGELVADMLLAAAIGLVTGGTELVSRFRDRPLDAVASPPGILYMLINGFAAGLAFYIMVKWGIVASDPVKRVLVAGTTAMALFRSGLFTARVGTQDVSFGPNMLLKVVLDALDRAYDRERAFRRAALIVKSMGGIDFQQAKISLPEVCANLLQNIGRDERDAVDAAITKISATAGLSDDARSMAMGLVLMGVVGEDTLSAATKNLGSTIFGFRELSEDVLKDLAKRDPKRVIQDLFDLCNQLAHERARLKPEELLKRKNLIVDHAGFDPSVKARLVAYDSRQQYGEALVKSAIAMLPEAANPEPPKVPDAPPPLPPELPKKTVTQVGATGSQPKP